MIKAYKLRCKKCDTAVSRCSVTTDYMCMKCGKELQDKEVKRVLEYTSTY